MSASELPPFDGSPVCPACSHGVRAVSARLHNFLVRWPEPHSFSEFLEWRQQGTYDVSDAMPVPAVQAMLAVHDKLWAVCQSVEDDGDSFRWTTKVHGDVALLIPAAERALFVFQPISDGHFADYRHALGQENLLAPSSGVTHIRFLPRREWDYRIEAVPSGGDLTHLPCGTHIKLHEHFLANIRRDPTFYGKARCPFCPGNHPFSEFRIEGERDDAKRDSGTDQKQGGS